jgi:hypothetical protein
MRKWPIEPELVHILLAVNGTPRLTRCRRVIVTVFP